MTNHPIRLFSAAILALAMVPGVSGCSSAKPNPSRTVTITPNVLDLPQPTEPDEFWLEVPDGYEVDSDGDQFRLGLKGEKQYQLIVRHDRRESGEYGSAEQQRNSAAVTRLYRNDVWLLPATQIGGETAYGYQTKPISDPEMMSYAVWYIERDDRVWRIEALLNEDDDVPEEIASALRTVRWIKVDE